MKPEKINVLLEALAELEHLQWIVWSKEMVRAEKISMKRVKRWGKQWCAYSELSEIEKGQDRYFAQKVIDILIEKGVLQ